MYSYPIIFKQTKTGLVKGGVWLIFAYVIVGVIRFGMDGDMRTVLYMLVAFAVVLLIFKVVPLARLELHKDKFVFQRGSKQIETLWQNVRHIGFQANKNSSIPSKFFIVTNETKTPLLGFHTLERQYGSKIEIEEFIELLNNLSGKKALVDDYHIYKGYKGKKKALAVVLGVVIVTTWIFLAFLNRPENLDFNYFINYDFKIILIIVSILILIVGVLRKK